MYVHLIPLRICSLMGLSFLCPLLDYRSSTHITSTHPFLLHPVNLLILPVHSLQQIQKQSTVSWLCSDLALCSLSPFEHITDQPMTDPTVPSWFIDGSTQKHAPFGAGYTIVQGHPPSSHHISHNPSSHTLTARWTDSSYTSLDPSQRTKGKHLQWL